MRSDRLPPTVTPMNASHPKNEADYLDLNPCAPTEIGLMIRRLKINEQKAAPINAALRFTWLTG